jgi:glycosyltransferase involved in cell wall biosynthesis
MRILIFTPYIGNNYGGIGKAVEGIAGGLANQDIDVDVITTNANSLEKIPVITNQWICENEYRIRYFNCWHKDNFVWSWGLIFWFLIHIREYNLIHTNTVFAPIVSLIYFFCWLLKVPYIVTPHGMLEPWALSYKAGKKRIYYNLVEKKLIQQAELIHVIAESEAKNINSLGFEHLISVPNGIYRHEFVNLPDADIFYQKFPTICHKSLILFLGRIDPKKGLDLLAPAFAEIHQKFPETHLIVAGPDSIGFLSQVQDYFAQAGCLDAVTFTGMLTGELKYALLAAAKLYVAPSYSEGFSISILEGMAAGLPCVITTECNFPEAGSAEAAYIVDVNSQAIALALNHCLTNPQQAKQTGDRARELIMKNYTWDSAATKLIIVYQAIIAHQPLPIFTSNTHQ